MTGPRHPGAPKEAILDSLWDLVEDELLPTCEEAMSFAHGGWTRPAGVDAGDAEWFIAAIRSGLVEPTQDGGLRLPASRFLTVAFWEGKKDTEPRRISFAMEGFLSTATAARLHMLHGWPRNALGFESIDDAFDLIGMVPGRPYEYLAGEHPAGESSRQPTAKRVRRVVSGGLPGLGKKR